MPKVTVHDIEVYDINVSDSVRLPFKSTAEWIKELPHTGGKPRIVPGTAEEVDAYELDMHRRNYPEKSQP